MRRVLLLFVATALVTACGSGGDRARPADQLRDGQPGVMVEREWRRPAGSGILTEGGVMPPVLVDDTLHVADRRGRLSAYDASSGALLWRHSTGARISAGPGVGDGVAVVATRKGRVVAVDVESGEERWESEVSSEVLGQPVIHDDRVIVRSNDGRVYGLSLETGSRRWLEDVSVPSLSLRGTSNPVRFEDRILIGFETGLLRSLDLRSGEQQWEVTVAEPRGSADLDRVRDVDSTPVVDEGTVFVAGYRGQLMALDAETGNPRWQREFSAYADLAVDDERVYASDDRGRVWGLDRDTGSALWRQNETRGLDISGVVVHDSFLVFGDDRGRLNVLDPEDGRLMARVAVGDEQRLSQLPVSDGEGLLVVSDRGELSRYRLRPRARD